MRHGGGAGLRITLAVAIVLVVVFALPLAGVAVAHDESQVVRGVLPPDMALQQAACAPRPPVRVLTEKIGERDFRVTVTAGLGAITMLRFGNAPTARIDLPGQQPGVVPPFDYKPPAAAVYTFVVDSSGVGTAVTVPITIFDGCGAAHPWDTFVGGGTGATRVQLALSNGSANEGDAGTTPVTLTLSLGSAASVPVSVQYSTSNGTATAGVDYTAASGVVSFAPGETSKSIVVQILGDIVDEPNETFTVTLANATNATIEDGTATVTIVNDDAVPTAVNDAATVAEDAAATAINVLANDPDPDGGPKTIQSVTQPVGGSVAIVGGGTGLTYTPTANSCNTSPGTTLDTFTYTLNGGAVGTVTITVTCVNDAPTRTAGTVANLTVAEDAAATSLDLGAVAYSTGPANEASQTLTYRVTAVPPGTFGNVLLANGVTVVTANTAYTLAELRAMQFRPSSDENGGPQTFSYTVTDNGTTNNAANPKSVTESLTIAVTPVNDPPSFTVGANQTNVHNQNANGTARSYTISPWIAVASISKGPANEASQTVSFAIDSNSNPGLFTVAPAVSPTGVLTFTTNPAQTGTATVTLHIVDSGSNVPPNDNASATQQFTIQTIVPPPQAQDDSYTATGNVSINVNTVAEGVLQRGTDDVLIGSTITHCGPATATVTAVAGSTCTTTSANGGAVVLNVNGTFTYNPPAGFTGANDEFSYRLTGTGGVSTGKVTVAVSGMIWFVDADNATAGDGRLSNPFKQLASFNNGGGTNQGKDGQTIFLEDGLYSGGVQLRPNQILIGKGATASIQTIAGLTLAPFSATLPTTGGTRPTVENSSGLIIRLSSGNNTVRGLNVEGTALCGIFGVGFGTLTLSEVNILVSGQALNLTTGTVNATFGTISASNGSSGIDLSDVVANIVATSTTVSGTSNEGIMVGSTSGTVNFGTTSVTSSGGTGVILSSNSAAITFGDLDISPDSGQSALYAINNTGTLTTTSGTVSTSNAISAIEVITTTIGNSTPLNMTFTTVNVTGGTRGIVVDRTTGSFAIAGDGTETCRTTNVCTGGTIQNVTGDAISLADAAGVSLTSMRIENGGQHGIHAIRVNGLTVTLSQIRNTGNDAGEHGLSLREVRGTVTVDRTSVQGAATDLIFMDSIAAEVTLNVKESDFAWSTTDTPFMRDALNIRVAEVPNFTVNIEENSFVDIPGAAARFSTIDEFSTGTYHFTFSNNNVFQTQSDRASNVVAIGQGSTTTNVTISDNVFMDVGGDSAISIVAQDQALVQGRVTENQMNSPTGKGMHAVVQGGATAKLVMHDNAVTSAGSDGIRLENLGSPLPQTDRNSRLDVTLTENLVSGHNGSLTVARLGGIVLRNLGETTGDKLYFALRDNVVRNTPTVPARCSGVLCVDYHLEEVAGEMKMEEVPETVKTVADSAYVLATNDPTPAVPGLVTIVGTIDLSNGVATTLLPP